MGFEMLLLGLVEVPDASARLSERVQGAAGTTVLAALEGSRNYLAEVQVVGQPTPATPGRTVLVRTGDDFKCC